MTNPNAQKFTRALEAKGPARRCALYRWLHAHHAALSRSLDRPDRSWVEAAGLITAEGLFGANGKPISPKALRQMWLRVVRDVERERAAKPAEPDRPKPHRSRPAGSWSPPLAVLPAPQARSSGPWLPEPLEVKAPAPGKDQVREAEDTPQAIMARLQHTLAERSGH